MPSREDDEEAPLLEDDGPTWFDKLDEPRFPRDNAELAEWFERYAQQQYQVAVLAWMLMFTIVLLCGANEWYWVYEPVTPTKCEDAAHCVPYEHCVLPFSVGPCACTSPDDVRWCGPYAQETKFSYVSDKGWHMLPVVAVLMFGVALALAAFVGFSVRYDAQLLRSNQYTIVYRRRPTRGELHYTLTSVPVITPRRPPPSPTTTHV